MLDIITTENDKLKLLREKSVSVKLPLSKEDQDLLNQMYSFVKDPENKAVGLSAVQVGVLRRLCAIKYKEFSFRLANPIIIWHSSDKRCEPEGCLSIPEEHDEEITRWNSIKVSAYDLSQKKIVIIKATGFLAAIFQHEIDHMDGILFTDRILKEEN